MGLAQANEFGPVFGHVFASNAAPLAGANSTNADATGTSAVEIIDKYSASEFARSGLGRTFDPVVVLSPSGQMVTVISETEVSTIFYRIDRTLLLAEPSST